ncbi:MAG: isoprenylcysteine carboxylmethyltransferase family protein [Deltaproteobacteria bacterium]|nr:isoprenylcysteine carboxylmethyltransferase family protein [Deltaproteobacteria bacterium]
MRWIRPSTTERIGALWGKSLLNAVLFFCIFMILLPWGAHHLLPAGLDLYPGVRMWAAVFLGLSGLAIWIHGFDFFSRYGRGTPLPLDAPRHLVTSGLFGVVRNPIIAGELMVIWAEVLYLASLGLIVYAVLMSLAGHLLVVYVEEPELRERFGETYEAYSCDVPRWFPRRSG